MTNGLGPWWFPPIIRQGLTRLSSLFFDEAAWDKHDIGYSNGYPKRSICDKKFLQAMLRDASRTKAVWKIWSCVLLAFFYWILVRLFGWLSYNSYK